MNHHEPISRDLPNLIDPVRFRLVRREDKTGVSGTGTVANGVFWPNGLVSLAWRGAQPTCDTRYSLKQLNQIHLHHGATEVHIQSADRQPHSPDDGLAMAQNEAIDSIIVALYQMGAVVKTDNEDHLDLLEGYRGP